MPQKLSDTLDIKTYSLGIEIKDIYKEINDLVIDNIKNNTLPYVQDIPLPQDMNIVNGKHLADVNKVQLELKASQIGAKSLKWIFGADAALMGLELKEEGKKSEPIVVLANTRRDLSHSTSDIANTSNIAAEGMKVDAQTVYLLDQFTEQSVEKALTQSRIEQQIELRGNELAQKQKRVIAKNMIKNIAEYDSGLREKDLRAAKAKNVVENYKDPEVKNKMAEAFKNLSKSFDGRQKDVFNVMYSYYLKQETGLVSKTEPEAKKMFIENLWNLAHEENPVLAKTLTQSVLYTDRATQYKFDFERIYTEKDVADRTHATAPKAAEFKDYQPESLVSERVANRLREREREFKPRQVTHQRGF